MMTINDKPINDYTLKGFVMDVMVRPLPGVALKGALQAIGIWIISSALAGGIAWVWTNKISKGKEVSA